FVPKDVETLEGREPKNDTPWTIKRAYLYARSWKTVGLDAAGGRFGQMTFEKISDVEAQALWDSGKFGTKIEQPRGFYYRGTYLGSGGGEAIACGSLDNPWQIQGRFRDASRATAGFTVKINPDSKS